MTDLANWNSKTPESVADVDDLLHTCSCSNKLRAACCCLNGCLFLGEEVDGSPIGKMQACSDGAASQGIMTEVGINKVRELNRMSQRRRCIRWKKFLHVATDLEPVLFNLCQVAEVWLCSAEADAKVLGLVEALADSLCLRKMSTTWC